MSLLASTNNETQRCTISKKGVYFTFFWVLLIIQYTSIHGLKLASWRGPSSFLLGDVPVEREGHGMAEAFGKLFVFGGAGRSSEVMNDLHQFDPSTLAWTDLTSIHGEDCDPTPQPRQEFGFAASGDNLYVFGGRGKEGLLGDLHRYDPSALVWRALSAPGSSPPPRYGHGLAAAGDRLFVFGGMGESGLLNDLYTLDLEAPLEWTLLDSNSVAGTAPSPRKSLGFAAVGGRLYVFGGDTRSSEGSSASELYEYDPTNRRWLVLGASYVTGNPPSARYGHGFAALDGELYVFGGTGFPGGIGPVGGGAIAARSDLHKFNPKFMNWVQIKSIVNDHEDPTRTSIGFTSAENRLFVFGGVGTDSVPLNKLHVLDPFISNWTELGKYLVSGTPPNEAQPSMTAVNASLFVLGSKGDAYNGIYKFDTTLLQWSKLADRQFDIPRGYLASLHGKVLLCGIGEGPVLHLFQFDLLLEEWTQLSGESENAPGRRSEFGFTAANERAYVFGGFIGSEGATNQLLSFDMASSVWMNLDANLISGEWPSPRASAGFASMDDKLYLFGGMEHAAAFSNDLYQFDSSNLRWTKLSSDIVQGSPPTGRCAHGFTSANGKLFVFAGMYFPGYFNPVNLGDMHLFDPFALEWTQIRPDDVHGLAPSARNKFGFASVNGNLYVHGGESGSGTLHDTYQLDAPKVVKWPKRSGAGLFISVYDWDLIELETIGGNFLTTPVVLCSGFFPCSLSILGNRMQNIQRIGNGSILCLGSLGCTQLYVKNLHVACEENQLSTNPVLEVQGALASVQNSSFNGCLSAFDGSAIKAYDKAVVQVQDSFFIACRSLGSGGAISAFGSTATIMTTQFVNCTSVGGGGALSVAEYVCYGSTEIVRTFVTINACLFEGCNSDGLGGALFASSGTSRIQIFGTAFTGCMSKQSGGAVAAVDSATINITVSLFANNSAHGLGGGAIFSQDAIMALRGLACNGNAATGGGGGVVYWQGALAPNISPWCEKGWYVHPEFHCTPATCEYLCKACSTGSFQTMQGAESERDCNLCEAGKFSVTLGSSTCMDCSPGSFSTILGAVDASDCTLCCPGSYSEFAATSECSLCETGAYSSAFGSLSCIKCQAGEHSTSRGANQSHTCIACAAGTYSFTGAEECLECGYGTFSSVRSSTCVSCSAGTYSTVSRAPDNASCILCVAGTFSEPGATRCSSCEPGLYSSSEGRTSPADCDGCEAGTFSLVVGATSSSGCTNCGAGVYSAAGASACSVCESGKHSTAGRAESSMTCMPCVPGSFSVSGSAHCLGFGTFRQAKPDVLPHGETFELFLPFEFPFYNSNYKNVYVSLAGALFFGSSNEILFITDIPDPFTAETFIAAFSGWTLDHVEGKSSFLVFNETTQISIQWTNMGFMWDSWITFQVSLYQNGSILISYLDMHGESSRGSLSVIGIQSGIDGLLFSSHSPVLFPGLCLHFFPATEQSRDYEFETYRCPENEMIIPICPPGTFLGANMLCVPCEVGKYQTGEGMIFEQNCSLCVAGKYSITTASSAAELCLNCSDLFMNSSHDQATLNCNSGESHNNLDDYHRRQQVSGYKYTSNTLSMEGIPDVFKDTSRELVKDQGTPTIYQIPMVRKTLVDTFRATWFDRLPLERSLAFRYRKYSAMMFKSRTQFSREDSNLVKMWTQGNVFCENNIAVYGFCVASSCQNIQLEHIKHNGLVFPGLPFRINVAKKDFYNQTISSDSSTLLQVQAAYGGQARADHSIVLSGTPVFKLQAGTASVSIAVAPTILKLIPAAGVATVDQDVNIFIGGIDSETLLTLHSASIVVEFGSNTSVCPVGYVLDSSESNITDLVVACKFCPPGTYSLNPLFSTSGTYPSCLVCPSAGICNGGDGVQFHSGQWTVQAGMYILVSCPAGNRLINSIGRKFYQESQNCVPCMDTEYILSSDDPEFECQKCPLGAVCNGRSLNGTIKGSIWNPNMTSGQYILTSCPAGYEILNTDKRGSFSAENQECHLCPALFYCLGGAAARLVCPSGSFAQPGANSSHACTPAVFVTLTMTFAITPSQFGIDQQREFRNAVAFIAKLDTGQVVIESIFQMRRSSLQAESQIKVNIATNDDSSAASVCKYLTDYFVNSQLSVQGMYQGSLVSVAVQNPSAPSALNPGLPVSTLIGLVLGVGFLFLAGLGVIGYFVTKPVLSEDERMLLCKIDELRKVFKISKKDGYLLSSEGTSWWQQRQEYTVIHKSYLEAAARLALFWDFEIAKFDALCLCLELTYPTEKIAGPVAGSLLDNQTGSHYPYYAICDWLLEISKELIKPNLRHHERSSSDEMRSRKCSLRMEKRFPYLKQKVFRVRVWSEASSGLFDKLKAAVQLYMDDIARLCDDRFESLCREPGGDELIAFFAASKEERCEGLIAKQIRRQDHNLVRAITTNQDAQLEANLEQQQRTVCVESCRTRTTSVPSEITDTFTSTNFRRSFKGSISMAPLMGEDVFVAHLYHRAQLLNTEFQGRILEVVHGHAVPDNDMQELEAEKVPEPCIFMDDSPEVGHAVVVEISSFFENTRTHGGSLGTATNASTEAEAGISTADLIFKNDSRGTTISHASSQNEFGRYKVANTISTEANTPCDIMCSFSEGSRDNVEVCAGAIKTQARMREKLAEYAMEGLAWPLAACILDPVRASVICTGPARILEVANWFINAGSESFTESGDTNVPGGLHLAGKLLVCRIKNKFALDKVQLVGGYRDLMICLVFEGASGLRIIGEVQVHDKVLHDLKNLMHKLYRIQRAQTIEGI